MAVFGLPPVAHKNDPARAVMAALHLKEQLRKFNMEIYMERLKEQQLLNGNKSNKHNSSINSNAKLTTKRRHYAAIGITSGIVYLGLVGGIGTNKEYSVLGDKVNLSARLMSLAKKNPDQFGEIVVDSSVKEKCQKELTHYVIWKDLKLTKVKGKTELIHIWKPILKKYQTPKKPKLKSWVKDDSDRGYIQIAC